MAKSAFNHLVKNSLIYGVGQALSRFIGFLLLPVFTAYLSPADYGILAILGVMNLVATALFSLGFGAATGLCYFEGCHPLRKAQTIWTSLFILAACVLALGAMAILFPQNISGMLFKTPAHVRLVTLSLLSAGTVILNLQLLLYLMFEKRALLYAAISLVITILTLGMSVLAVVVLGRGVAGMVESILIANSIGLAMLAVPAVRGLPFCLSGTVARDLLRFGVPLIPSSFFLFVLQQGNQYLLERFRGLGEVGIYVIGFNFGLVMNLLATAFSSAWYPHFMSYMDRPSEARDILSRVVTFYILGAGMISLLFYAAARPVVLVMTQPPFHEAYRMIGPAATAFSLGGLFMVLLPPLYYTQDVKYLSAIQGAAAALAVIFNLVLIPTLGMVGAAAALVLGNLSLVVIQLAWYRARRRTYVQIAYEWRRILPFGALYVLFCSLTLWPRQLTLSHEMVFSGFLAFSLVFMGYRFLTDGEKRFITSILRRYTV